MEKQEMTPAAAAHPTNYVFTPQTPQMPSDMDWSFFLSDPDPEQVPSQYEMPSASVTTTLVSEDQTKISNCDDHDHLKEEEDEEEEEEEQDRNKEKRRASRVSRRKAGPPRVEFQTKSSEDLLDDGYRWRKYGQKSVKNSLFPR